MIRAVLLTLLLVLGLGGWISPVHAVDLKPKEGDAIYVALGRSKVQVTPDGEELSGLNGSVAWRLQMFWTVFLEAGLGGMIYQDSAIVGGVERRVTFRTSGTNLGTGFWLPLGPLRLGGSYSRNLQNRWVREESDPVTGVTLSSTDGTFSYDTYRWFAIFGAKGGLEVGVRRDVVRDASVGIFGSDGAYLAWNFGFK